MSQMIHRWWPIERLRLSLRWRRCRKRGSGIRVYIRNYAEFAKQLRHLGVEHTLLRSSSVADGRNDFDILLNYQHLQKFLGISASNSGMVPVDVYFDLRPSVETYHYFPPVLARKIIESSEVDEFGQTVPDPAMRFYSLLYHVLYHKGLNESLATPLEDTVVLGPHYQLLKRLAAHPDVGYGGAFDVLSLHSHMDSCGWSMPRDLLRRWPRQHRLLSILHDSELRTLQKQHQRPDRIVFIVRDDSDELGILSAISALLREKCNVCSCRQLTTVEKQLLITRTRGGNWYENISGRFTLVGPSYVLICSAGSRTETESFCREELAPLKHYVREQVNRLYPLRKGKRFVLHAGDDLWESADYLSTLGISDM
jgi:hypothetical protein